MKYSAVAVLVSLAVVTTTVQAFDWTSTVESSHQHSWSMPASGSRIDHQFELAQKSSMERRLRLGKALPKATATPDTSVNGFLGGALGFAYGLQYDPKTPGICYSSIESTLYEFENIMDLLAQIYIPSKWADMMMGVQDWVKMSTAVYANCDIQKFFNTMTAVITGEGSSTMAARLAGGFIMELPGYIGTMTDATVSDFIRFNAAGKTVQLVFNYSLN